jgi:hypothetical protein
MQKAMYNCRLHHRLKQQRYRRKRDKTVENYDGWARYPLSLTSLRDAPYKRNTIEAFINTHDLSRIRDYGNVLRLAPHENCTWPPMGPPSAAIGSLHARSALHRLPTTLGFGSAGTSLGSLLISKPMLPAVGQNVGAQEPRWYQIWTAWSTNFGASKLDVWCALPPF